MPSDAPTVERNPPPELPRPIVELIYRSSCCKPTPEEASKEACACVAAEIIEQVEKWCRNRVEASKPQMTAGEFAGLLDRSLYDLRETAECGFELSQAIDKLWHLAREHNIEIVEPKKC